MGKFKNIARKLSSRKLWLAIGGIATGIAIACGADASEVKTVAGAVTALISAVTYIITEGRVDAANVANTITKVQDAVDTISQKDPKQEEKIGFK